MLRARHGQVLLHLYKSSVHFKWLWDSATLPVLEKRRREDICILKNSSTAILAALGCPYTCFSPWVLCLCFCLCSCRRNWNLLAKNICLQPTLSASDFMSGVMVPQADLTIRSHSWSDAHSCREEKPEVGLRTGHLLTPNRVLLGDAV